MQQMPDPMQALSIHPNYTPYERNNVEPGVQKLCEVLNTIDNVRTLYSCEGHPELPTPPYVMFEAPTHVAFSIHKLLGHGRADGTLTFSWQIESHFNISMDGGWHYVISPNDIRFLKRPTGFFVVRKPWNSSTARADMDRISEILKYEFVNLT